MSNDSEKFKWTDFAKNGVANRNNCVDYHSTFWGSFSGRLLHEDAYMGMFAFDDSFKDHISTNKSVSGFSGPTYAPYVIIDIDSPTGDIEEAAKVASDMVSYLIEDCEIEEKSFYLFFSGAKGFHIYIPDDLIGIASGQDANRTIKRFVSLLAKYAECPLAKGEKAGIDLIYDKTRLIRLPNSKHKKSGLYKVQVQPRDVFGDINHIYERAQLPKEPLYVLSVDGPNEKLKTIMFEATMMAFEEEPMDRIEFPISRSGEDAIKNGKICIARLMHGVGSGERDKVSIRLSDHYRKQGLSIDAVEGILLSWNLKNDPPMQDWEVRKSVKSAFSNNMDFGCYDDILASRCSNKCFLYSKLVKGKKEDDAISHSSFKTKESIFKEYVDRFYSESGGITLGIPELDQYVKLHMGHVLQYMAKAGGGKTAFAMHCMNNLSKMGIPSLFMSLEMTGADIAERGFQMASNKTSVALERIVVDLMNAKKTKDEISKGLTDKTGDAFKNVFIVDEDSIDIDKIEQYVHKAKELYGVKVVFIDYLNRVAQKNANSYEHISGLAKGLKTIAKRHEMAVFYLHQVNRSVENSEAIVEISSGRDSGQTEESADIILGSFRPGVSTGEDKFVIRVLKNRRGKANIDVTLVFDTETMQFKTPQEDVRARATSF